MKQLNKILTNTNWATVSNTINNNNDRIFSSVSALEHAAFKQKGYYKTLTALKDAYPYAESGSQAFVYNASNGSAQPYDIYEWDGNNWVDTGVNGGSTSVNLDSKQDTIHGYTENVTNGQVTQIALQADTIVLGGKASIGQIGDVESSIMTSSQQASNAIAKANTLEQSINALKSPVKPIHLNSQGKLELSVGKGLYIEEGKLCATGASSSSGGGGKTYSEGNGIIITDDTINVNYDADTMCLNSCGGLAVNIGEGFIMKDGKLSVQASVNAGNGLVKKGDKLQVSVGTGLLVQDDVYVNLGKGLATDNENKVNVNLDEQTLTTDSSGKVIVNKDGLIGNGLKQEYSKLAVNYGTGLALSNKAIVVKYGSGLDINSCGKLYVKDGGKTYIGGQAVDISGNEINVKYDGVTISTKDTTDNSLHVVLGSGLTQGTNGINLTEDILNLSTRVYELGDFASSEEAENKAKEASISGDNEIVIMRYTVSSAKKQGVILQQVGDYRTIQYLLWDGGIYTRYIWFTNDTRQTLNSNLNAREKWWKLGATHTNYDSSTRKIHLANKDDSNINANESAVIPIVSSSVAGLMSSDMLDTLNGSQPQLERYSEGLSGTKTTASINADEISMSGSSLKLHNVLRVCGALFTDLQTKGNININAKSVIASNINAGELKVLNGASPYGFILRTVENPNNPQGLMLAELLSTDGYNAYKYTFPPKSGEVALKGDYSEGDGIRIIDDKINVAYDLETIVLDDCGGLAVNFGSGLEMQNGKLCAVKQEGQTYIGGDGITIDGCTISVKTDPYSHIVDYGDGLAISTKTLGGELTTFGYCCGFAKGCDIPIIMREEGLHFPAGRVGYGLCSWSGLLQVNYGIGLSVNSSNQIYVDTSKIAGVGMNFEDGTKKLTIGTEAAKALAGSGLKQVGPQLVVDAENLTVGKASFADYTPESCSAQYANYAESAGTASSATYASRATSDICGNAIHSTYISKSQVGKGLTMNNAKLVVDPHSLLATCGALCVDGEGLNINVGDGLEIKSNKVVVALSSHLTIDYQSSGLSLRLGSGLTLEKDEFYHNASKVNVKLSSNLTIKHEGIVVNIGSGLTTDNRGVIKLPFVTALLVNNAVDKTTGGSQRVLNINPDTIQIKLSTGLGIDEYGYLYVTK